LYSLDISREKYAAPPSDRRSILFLVNKKNHIEMKKRGIMTFSL